MTESLPTKLPCGCVMSTTDEGAFVFQPCSPTCDYYAYAIESARKQGKPITTIDTTNSGHLSDEHRCPYCLKSADGYSGGDEGSVPKSGDVALCAYCGKFGFYTGRGIRKPTIDEGIELAQNPVLMLMAERLRKAKHGSN